MINRYKSEYIYSITRQILALLILSPIFSAQATTAKNICNKFSQNKSMQAFLFDSLGKQELPYFDLGKLDATTSEQNEYLVAKKFRLVIYPNYIQPESLGGKTLFLISRK